MWYSNIFLAVVLCCLHSSFEVPVQPEFYAETGNANDYLDKVLVNVRELIVEKGLDPYSAFDSKVLGIRLTGDLSNLASLHRVGESTLTYDSKKGGFIVEASFRVHDLKARIKWSTHILLIPIEGSAAVEISEAVASIKLTTDVENMKFVIDKFHIKSVGQVDTHLDVIPIINTIAEKISNIVGNFVKDHVARLLEGPIKSFIQQALEKYGLPELDIPSS